MLPRGQRQQRGHHSRVRRGKVVAGRGRRSFGSSGDLCGAGAAHDYDYIHNQIERVYTVRNVLAGLCVTLVSANVWLVVVVVVG